MIRIRLIAAAAAALGVGFTLSPASARSCDGGNTSTRIEHARCAEAQPAPVKLDPVAETSQPVAAVPKQKAKSKSVRHATREAKAEAKRKAAAVKAEAAEAKAEPAAAETVPPSAAGTRVAAAGSETAIQPDGGAVASPAQPKQFDQTADQIQVVAANDMNEIDLTAPPPPPVRAETFGHSVASEQTPADNFWIPKLLLAAAGSIAVAGATRFLLA
jgi:hypothetical protein